MGAEEAPSGQVDTLLAQLTSLTNPPGSPAKTSLVASRTSPNYGGPEMRQKVQATRDKLVAATQPSAARPQASAVQDIISAATTSAESRERYVGLPFAAP